MRRGSVVVSPPGWPGCAGVGNFTAISSGPFDPAPNPPAIASYACREVVDFGSTLWSDWPRRRWISGNASTSGSTALPIMYGRGLRPTARAIRAQPWGFWSSGCVRPMCTRSELMCSPSAPSSAGRSVTAASTETATAIAAV